MPKNVIFIMGDGMGAEHIEAGRMAGDGTLRLDALGAPVLLNTDSITTDATGEPTDSAAAATALATGRRVANGVVSVDGEGASLTTILELARAEGKAVGIVTTATVYDASPAAFIAHAEDRGEALSIAQQLLTQMRPEVAFGGGADLFESNDGALLTTAANEGYTVLRTADDLAAWDPAAAPLALGLFESSAESAVESLYPFYMTPMALRDESSTDPLLDAMVGRALERLAQDPDGFFLFVEDETIDTLGHLAAFDAPTSRVGIPAEVGLLDSAVGVALDWVAQSSSLSDTLLIVTSDHESGGYTLDDDLEAASFAASPYHTGGMVPLYADGPGTDDLSSMCGVADVFLLMTGQLP